jgi:glycerol-3-phosphate dehydrogenase
MPITGTVKKIINNETPAKEAIGELFSRPEKEEFADHF